MRLYALFGFLTIFIPHVLLLSVAHSQLKKFASSKLTVSSFALKYSRYKFIVKLATFLNGVWSAGFLVGLMQIINPLFTLPFLILSLATVFCFFITAFTLTKMTARAHTHCASLLVFCLTSVKILFGISAFFYVPNLAILSILLGIIELILLLKQGFEGFTGESEVIYTTTLSVWVFFCSLYMFLH